METYTQMRAFHLMRNNRSRVRSVLWPEGTYCYVDSYTGTMVIKDTDGGHYSLRLKEAFDAYFDHDVLMGSWEVVS